VSLIKQMHAVREAKDRAREAQIDRPTRLGSCNGEGAIDDGFELLGVA